MSTPIIDTAGAVRPGEELDLPALDAWLRQQLPGLQGQPEVTQYSGGASNWTYRVAYANEDLILRRPPAGTKAKSAHDMGREYRLQAALKPVFPFVPTMRAHCEDPAVIGAEFYVMDRLSGIILRRNPPRDWSQTPEQVRALCLKVLDTLIALHQVDHQAAGLAHLGAGQGYARRQIEGWSRRYRDARTWNVPGGERIMDWLMAHLPRTERICITHNDFRFDNDAKFGNNLLPGAPRHYLRAELLYKHANGFYVGPNLEWVPQAYFVDSANTLTTEPYALLGLKAGIDNGGPYSIYIEGRNLLDKTYIASASIIDKANAASPLFEPGTGRAVYAGFKARW